MKWGIFDNQKIEASPNKKAYCELCNGELIPKCGTIKIWHWAHKSKVECDPWWEPESEWHISWKNEFPKEQQEVIIKKCTDYIWRKHRADISVNSKIIELQATSISPKEITERENFYNDMIWILNGRRLAINLEFRKKKENIITFRWKHPPKSWWNAKKKIFIDLIFGDKLFLIKKVYHNIPCGGYGVFLNKEELLNEVKNGRFDRVYEM
jgi:competence protein CoiA